MRIGKATYASSGHRANAGRSSLVSMIFAVIASYFTFPLRAGGDRHFEEHSPPFCPCFVHMIQHDFRFFYCKDGRELCKYCTFRKNRRSAARHNLLSHCCKYVDSFWIFVIFFTPNFDLFTFLSAAFPDFVQFVQS